MKSNIIFAALTLAFLPFSLSAREGAKVSMKIDFVAWGNEIGGLSANSGKGKITALAFRYSEPLKYSGPSLLELHQSGSPTVDPDLPPMTAEDKEHESKPLIPLKSGDSDPDLLPMTKLLAKMREEDPTLVALVPLPAEARRVTVLLAPAAGGTYLGYVINDDPSKLPAGKVRVHNLSPHTIRMRFSGGGDKTLEARGTMLENAKDGQAIYQLAYRIGDVWKVQENNIIPVDPDEQTQFVVLKSRNPFFLSSDGASGGFLQMVTLRRKAD